MRIRTGDAVDFFSLATAQSFVGIQTSRARQESLPAEHLVDAGNAACETIRGAKKSGVRVRHFRRRAQKIDWNLTCRDGAMALIEQRHGIPGPHRPVTKKPANYSHLACPPVSGEPIWRKQIRDDLVVVAGVKRDVVSA